MEVRPGLLQNHPLPLLWGRVEVVLRVIVQSARSQAGRARSGMVERFWVVLLVLFLPGRRSWRGVLLLYPFLRFGWFAIFVFVDRGCPLKLLPSKWDWASLVRFFQAGLASPSASCSDDRFFSLRRRPFVYIAREGWGLFPLLVFFTFSSELPYPLT